jgi:hypothetical protein
MSTAEHGHERAPVRATWALVAATVALVIVTALLPQATWQERRSTAARHRWLGRRWRPSGNQSRTRTGAGTGSAVSTGLARSPREFVRHPYRKSHAGSEAVATVKSCLSRLVRGAW